MKRFYLLFLKTKGLGSLFTIIIFCIIFFSGCATTKPPIVTPFFSFDYNGEEYRVRSITSVDETISRNELIGKIFLAHDFDQDGIIDLIILGEIDLSEAQTIYEYALSMLAKENKLREINQNVNKYQYVNSEFTYEIISFRPNDVAPFNELRIIKHNQIVNQPIIIIIDQKANGKLDKVIKGNVALEKFQSKYSELLITGVQKNKMIEVDNMILLKE